MLKKYVTFFLLVAIGIAQYSYGQEIKVFKVEDFDLRGNVESCLVITDYGKEEYNFDETGRLTKSVTRYNDSDYETTYYKYENGELIQKRVENYLDNTFDSATSLANFYDIDTTGNRKIIEKIVSYDKELLEQNEYYYDADEKLVRIVRTGRNETDENLITYSTKESDTTVTQKVNGKPLKSVLTLNNRAENDSLQRTVLTKKYLDGILNTEIREVYNAQNQLISSKSALLDSSTEKWIPQEEIQYTYNEKGMLATKRTKRRFIVSTQEYIYQFDGSENGNWVKEIVTPDNTYTTRKIKYYDIPILIMDEE